MVAIRATHRCDSRGADRVFAIMMNELDERVLRCAYDTLGDDAENRLLGHWAAALDAGDSAAAQRVAAVMGTVPSSPSMLRVFRSVAAKFLADADRSQCVATLAALATLYPRYDYRPDRRDWQQIAKRAWDALQRLGIEETWRQFVTHLSSDSKSHPEFVRHLIMESSQPPDTLAVLLVEPSTLWPDDRKLMALRVWMDIERGNRAEAIARLNELQERFDESIDHAWIGQQFARLDLPHDALRHSRIAAERGPARAEPHFMAGWFAFVTGDLRASVESTRRGLDLEPTRAMGEFNLGLVLLALDETTEAEAAYRRGIALALRQSPADARRDVEGALGDFSGLAQLSDRAAAATERVRSSLRGAMQQSGEAAPI